MAWKNISELTEGDLILDGHLLVEVEDFRTSSNFVHERSMKATLGRVYMDGREEVEVVKCVRVPVANIRPNDYLVVNDTVMLISRVAGSTVHVITDFGLEGTFEITTDDAIIVPAEETR